MNQTPIVKTLHWPHEDACQAFAASLSGSDKLANAVICLHGDLGSGKTTFTRYVLQALGVTGRIKSPTYAVVESYECQREGKPLLIWHFDFYRFKEPQEWEDAGFRDIFAAPGLKMCEWPEQAAGFLPAADLDMAIEVHADISRTVTLTAHSDIGRGLLV